MMSSTHTRKDTGFPTDRQSEENPHTVENMRVDGVDQTENLGDPTKMGSDQRTTHSDQGTMDQTLDQTDEIEFHAERSNNSKICSEHGIVDPTEARSSQVDHVSDDEFETRLLVISQLMEDLNHCIEFEEFGSVLPGDTNKLEDSYRQGVEKCRKRAIRERDFLLELINQVKNVCEKFSTDSHIQTTKYSDTVPDPLTDIGNTSLLIPRGKSIDMVEKMGAIGKENSEKRLIGYESGEGSEKGRRPNRQYEELISYHNFLETKKSEYHGVLGTLVFKMVEKYLKLLYRERNTPYSEDMKELCMKWLDEYEKERDEVVREIKRIIDETEVERPRYLTSLDEKLKSDAEQTMRSKLKERKSVNSTIERINWMIEESKNAANNRCENSISSDKPLGEKLVVQSNPKNESLQNQMPGPVHLQSDVGSQNAQEMEIRLSVVSALVYDISSICEFDSGLEQSETVLGSDQDQLKNCFKFLTKRHKLILKYISDYTEGENQSYFGRSAVYEAEVESEETHPARDEFQLFHEFRLMLNEELKEIKWVLNRQFERVCNLIKTQIECFRDEGHQPNTGHVERRSLEQFDEYKAGP